MRIIALLFLVLIANLSCRDNDENLKQQEEDALSQMYLKIDKISNSVICTNAGDWKFTAIGEKPCGGPASYIPYHKSIDEAAFLNMIDDYNKAQIAFYERWGAVSDCTVTKPPKGISCVDGKALFTL